MNLKDAEKSRKIVKIDVKENPYKSTLFVTSCEKERNIMKCKL